MRTKINDKRLAKISGNEAIKIPYTNHKTIPAVNIEIQPNETSFVCFVFHDLTACGTNAVVVNTAATKPMISI